MCISNNESGDTKRDAKVFLISIQKKKLYILLYIKTVQ